jgi:hypothetical protein
MAAAAARQLLVHRISSGTLPKHTLNSHGLSASQCWNKAEKLPHFRARVAIKPPNAVPGKGGIVPADDDGISLGTVKLPGNIDVARFESLLFQVSIKLSLSIIFYLLSWFIRLGESVSECN